MLTSYISNWKKTASAAMKQEEAELAFAKAASAVIESKAAPFFKDDYYLGFEIVKSFNNEFTKMVGIFVFRVNKDLYYVPVFYMDGAIKCTDLLYIKDDSMFTLLSPNLLSSNLASEIFNSGYEFLKTELKMSILLKVSA